MNKYFICLANSYKHGNRCIAGVEVYYNHVANTYQLVKNAYGDPKWFRPINNNTDGGAIPNNEATGIKLFDLIEATDVIACPSGAQVENFSYTDLKVVKSVPTSIQDLRSFSECKRKTVFGNKGAAVNPEIIDKIGYSILMIEPETVSFYLKDRQDLNKRSQPRAVFRYKGIEYDLPVTDPDYRHQIEDDVMQSNSHDCYFLTLSLGIENEGWHSKLVAGVITHDNVAEKQCTNNSSQKSVANTSQMESFLMFKEGLSIPEIAASRGISENTIYSHLTFFVENNLLDAHKIVSEKVLSSVAGFKKENPDETSLKAYYMGLEEKVSYNELKVALAYLNK